MKLKFSPMRSDMPLEGSVQGDLLTLNGQVLDFSEVAEGSVEPFNSFDCPWLGSDVCRVDGEICVILIIPHGPNAPQETLFPSNFDTFLTVSDGPVPVPAYDVAQG